TVPAGCGARRPAAGARGSRPPRAPAAPARRRQPLPGAWRWSWSCLSFRRNHEVRTAVLRPGVLGVGLVEGELLAVTDCPQPVGRDAERHHVGLGRRGATFAEREVVLGRAALVTMPL